MPIHASLHKIWLKKDHLGNLVTNEVEFFVSILDSSFYPWLENTLTSTPWCHQEPWSYWCCCPGRCSGGCWSLKGHRQTQSTVLNIWDQKGDSSSWFVCSCVHLKKATNTSAAGSHHGFPGCSHSEGPSAAPVGGRRERKILRWEQAVKIKTGSSVHSGVSLGCLLQAPRNGDSACDGWLDRWNVKVFLIYFFA